MCLVGLHPPQDSRTGRAACAWRLAAAVPGVGFLAIVLSPPLNHDAAAVLGFAERWLAGEGLYTDLIDVNPPLIFILNALPAALAAHAPIGAVAALQLCLLALCAFSVLLAWCLVPRDAGAPPIGTACLIAALPVLTLGAGYEFAQREHIMVVAALPYLLLAAQRAEGRATTGPALAIGVAVLAALGFALKPHFLAIPALVEALVLAWRGPRRALRDPVPWTMAGVWLVYLAAIALFFPAYTARVLPMIRAYYIDLSGFSWWQILLTERLGTAILVLLPLGALAFLPGARHRFGALPQVLALAALGAALSAVVQLKGWDYHAVPARLITGLLAVVMAACWLDRALPAAQARRAAAPLALAATLSLAVFQITGAAAPWRELRWPASDGGLLAATLEWAAEGQRVLVLSPYIDPVAQALAYAEARSTLPTMTIWPLQGVYAGTCARQGARYREAAEMPPAETLVWHRVVREFAAAPPAALLVAVNPLIANCGRGFDLLEYYARHPAFAATMRRYRAGPVVAGHRLYTRIE